MSLPLINCQFYKEKEEFFIAKKPIKLVNNILRGKNLSNKGGLIKHFSHFFESRNDMFYFILLQLKRMRASIGILNSKYVNKS